MPDTSSNNLAEFLVASGGALSPFPLQPTNNQPYTLAVTPNNQFMYVGDLGGFVDAFVVAQNGTLTAVPPPVASAGNVTGIAIDASGKYLYASNGSGNQIVGFSINQSTGALTPLASSPVILPGGTNPRGMATDAAGHLYVAFGTSNLIGEYSINSGTGALSPIGTIATPLTAGFSQPDRIAINPAGTMLYETNYLGGTIGIYTIGGGGVLSANGSVAAPGTLLQGIEVHNNGNIVYAVDNGHNTNNVLAYTVTGGGGLLFAGAFTAGSAPVGTSIDPSGTFLFVSNSGSSNVTKFAINTANGTLSAAASVSVGPTATPGFLIARPAAFNPSTVPAASTWSLALLGILLVGSSAFFLYRRAYR